LRFRGAKLDFWENPKSGKFSRNSRIFAKNFITKKKVQIRGAKLAILRFLKKFMQKNAFFAPLQWIFTKPLNLQFRGAKLAFFWS